MSVCCVPCTEGSRQLILCLVRPTIEAENTNSTPNLMKIVYSCLTAVMLSGLFVALIGRDAVLHAQPPPSEWQYRVVEDSYTGRTGETLLNHVGRDGWELVTILPANDGSRQTYVLKKPR